MTNLTLLNKKIAEFKAGEAIEIMLNYKSFKQVNNCCIRMVIYHNGTPVGTILSETIKEEIIKNLTYETTFSFATDELAIGTYTASIGIYCHTDAGFHTPLDYLESAFSFQIVQGKIENKIWKHRFWGSVIFNQAKIVSHEEKEK